MTDEDVRTLFFGDFMNTSKGEDRLYDEIQALDELREVRALYVVLYMEHTAQMTK